MRQARLRDAVSDNDFGHEAASIVLNDARCGADSSDHALCFVRALQTLTPLILAPRNQRSSQRRLDKRCPYSYAHSDG
ncbi:MAG: hypothetical protein JWM08_1541 [Candidatus Angelobacter sp.]|nr:hypothetical protein [Candidatus Angelobacter sp.]